MPFDAEIICVGLLLPAFLAAGSLFLAGCFCRGTADRQVALAGAAGLGVGFFLSYALFSWSKLRPEDSWQWLPYLALAAGAAGLIELLFRVPWILIWVIRVLVAVASAWLLVPKAFVELKDNYLFWVAGLAGAILVLWAILAVRSHAQTGPILPFLLSFIAFAAALVIFNSGNAMMAQLAGIVAALFGGACLACLLNFRLGVQGMIPGLAVLLPGLLSNGWLNAEYELRNSSFLLIAVAPLAVALEWLPPLRSLPAPWPRRLSALLVLIVAAAVVLLALPELLAESPEEEDWGCLLMKCSTILVG